MKVKEYPGFPGRKFIQLEQQDFEGVSGLLPVQSVIDFARANEAIDTRSRDHLLWLAFVGGVPSSYFIRWLNETYIAMQVDFASDGPRIPERIH